MGERAIQSIAVIGGGRWSRVVIDVLREVAPSAYINWVTNHGFDAARKWCKQHGATNATVTRTLEQFKTPDAAIVANAPHEHFKTVVSLLELSIPTLCEKPVTLRAADANDLARQVSAQSVPLGVNLVFLCASYVQEFAAQIRGMDIRSLEIVWHDPWVEQRHGELKHAAFHTEMTYDMLPHAWSLLRVCLGANDTEVRDVHYAPASITVYARHGDCDVEVSLSRRAASRRREVVIDGGKAILDFALEPGVATIEGRCFKNAWKERHPLAESLTRFLHVASNSELASEWSQSIEQCLGSVRLATEATELLHQAYRKSLTTIQQTGFDIDNHEHLALAVDMLGPEYARRGHRMPLVELDQQRKAVCQWLTDPLTFDPDVA